MNITTSRRRPLTVGAVALALAIASVVGLSVPSHAVTASSSGSPGAVTLNLPVMRVTDQAQRLYTGTYWYNNWNRVFSTSGLTAQRSTAAGGAQTIGVQYVVQKISSNRWTTIQTSPAYTANLTSTQTHGNFPAWNAFPLHQSAGTYRMVVLVTWTGNGRVLGSQTIVTNRAGENVCQTVSIGCTPYTDAVIVR